jgi:hypothetical protein
MLHSLNLASPNLRDGFLRKRPRTYVATFAEKSWQALFSEPWRQNIVPRIEGGATNEAKARRFLKP